MRAIGLAFWLLGLVSTPACGGHRPDAALEDADDVFDPAPRSSGDLSADFALRSPAGVTADTFAHGVTITARVTLTNDGAKADCEAGSSGPIVSIALYQGDEEIASSTRGMLFTQSIVPFTLDPGAKVIDTSLSELRVSETETVGTLPTGSYAAEARFHFRCGDGDDEVRFEPMRFPFQVTGP